jgi:hypothetical protein
MSRTKIQQLLDRLCTELGFCLSAEQQSGLLADPPSTVDAFTDAVFVAEGLNPNLADRHLWRQVRDRVSQCFKQLALDADA